LSFPFDISLVIYFFQQPNVVLFAVIDNKLLAFFKGAKRHCFFSEIKRKSVSLPVAENPEHLGDTVESSPDIFVAPTCFHIDITGTTSHVWRRVWTQAIVHPDLDPPFFSQVYHVFSQKDRPIAIAECMEGREDDSKDAETFLNVESRVDVRKVDRNILKEKIIAIFLHADVILLVLEDDLRSN
jgi:hypothetical protein